MTIAPITESAAGTAMFSPYTHHEETAIIKAVKMEASDTYRVVAKTINHETRPINIAKGANPDKAPAPVAIPLPPRKRKYTGQLWPITARPPHSKDKDRPENSFDQCTINIGKTVVGR